MNKRKSCQLVALLMALFLWFQGSFASIGFSEQALDLGYSKEFVGCLSGLSPAERNTILKSQIFQNLSNLVELFLSDKKISSNEFKFISLVQKKYGKQKLNQNQAKFFFFLSTIPGYEEFFSFNLLLEDIDSLPLNKDILDIVTIEVYQKNDDRIPIFMHHSVDNSGLAITKKTFENQLSLLYNAGFSCMKLDDYIHGDFSAIPNGRKPIILTFDDGWKCHFSYLDKEGTKIDPDCVIGILNDFSQKNPLFGKAGVFFLYMSALPFTTALKQSEQYHLWKKKVEYLEKNGFEVGCHTYHHKDLRSSSEKNIIDEFNLFYNQLKTAKLLNLKNTMFLAYPWGKVPKNDHIVQDYSFESFKFRVAFLASKGFSKVPFSKNENVFQLPRISGYDSLLKPTILQKTFTKIGYKISLPKIFLSNDKLLRRWIEESTNYKTRYLLSDPSILLTILK